MILKTKNLTKEPGEGNREDENDAKTNSTQK